MLLIADELAGWFLNMSRYSGGTDNQFWLMAWDGHSHVTERVGRPPIELEHLLVGIAGGLQPDKIAECFKGAADGMYARFLLTWPDKAPNTSLMKLKKWTATSSRCLIGLLTLKSTNKSWCRLV